MGSETVCFSGGILCFALPKGCFLSPEVQNAAGVALRIPAPARGWDPQAGEGREEEEEEEEGAPALQPPQLHSKPTLAVKNK